MAKVYFKSFDNLDDVEKINDTVYDLLQRLIRESDIKLDNYVPLKVHFGEKGNTTFIKPVYFNGIKRYLNEKNIKTCYIETNVLYKGSRTFEQEHINTAKEHGFTDLDIIIADGNEDNPYQEVEVNLKNCKTCKIGTKFAEFKNMIVISHFKGHGLAGFGGALKQLAMGCAARGGKLQQHSNSKPIIDQETCIACGACVKKCPVNAIKLDSKAILDSNICIGCAGCKVVCPVDAISNTLDLEGFHEKLVEYAYAASLNKTIIYVNFIFNITAECDCFGRPLEIIAPNIGIMLSTDPVAIDYLALTKLREKTDNKLFDAGDKIFAYAESIGLGSTECELVELD